MTKIVGIFLVKNEDRFIKNALENVLDFCDEIIVLDNNSTDNTYTILEGIQKENSTKINLHKIDDALSSHGFIEKYANTDTWIFAVDGDEIYDKQGLKTFREEILTGKYKKYWKIFGNCIHVNKIDEDERSVYGYMTPPSRSITKLQNFNAIIKWDEHTERLHGTKMEFKEDFKENSVFLLHDIYNWENSVFRCLHMCFVNRSSKDTKTYNTRFNPLENSKMYFPFVNFIRNILRGNFSFQSSYKIKKYQRGKLEKFEISDFL